MSDKKNIDRLFMEKLKDFGATPNDSVWENISTELQSAGKQEKGIPIWWRVAGVAAALLLLFTISRVVLNNDTIPSPQETIVDVDSNKDSKSTDLQDTINIENTIAEEKNVSKDLKSESSNITSDSSVANSDTPAQNNNSVNESENRNVTVTNKTQNDNRNISNINKKELVTSSGQTKNAIVNNTDSKLSQDNIIDKEKTDAILDKENDTIEITGTIETTLTNANVDENKTESEEDKLSIIEEIAANEEENIEDTAEEEFERWKVASYIAPVYFNTLSGGSSIHPQFDNNSKSGDINLSYGISGSYAINKKLSVRSGIYKVKLGYSTNDVIVYNNIGGSGGELLRSNIELTETAQNLSFISVDVFNFAQVPGVFSDFIESSIDQKLGFIEIPLELEYKISDKKMGIKIIGGFSALFLNENEVFSVLEGNTTLLGKATNINNTSFSANIGLGFDFKISDKFNLNLEPVFKYQLNTFNNTSGNFKPYFIGVYSGLSFKF